MADTNGKQTKLALAHRIGIWATTLVILGKVLSMGAWVGAADEKFKDAETVETTQRALLLQVNTIATVQSAQTTAIKDNKDAIEISRKEILEAIKEASD